MATSSAFRRNLSAVLTFGRPPLVFGAFVCALAVMFRNQPVIYIAGLSFMGLSMVFDWVDGWFAERYIPHSRLAPLVDRMMDRIVLSIIFPVLGAGMLWRYNRLAPLPTELATRQHLLHALFVLAICVVVLLRDQIAQFLRSFSQGPNGELGEDRALTRLRTLVFSPMAVLLYAYAFYLPASGWERFYRWLDWLDGLPLRFLFVVEMLFLLINIASITLHLRKYGPLALEDISGDDETLRRSILACIPNGVTLLNGVLGLTAIVFASYGRMREALFILIGAAFFDRLDGLLARRLGLTDPLPADARQPRVKWGALLDDISDGISFCIAPAAIFYLVMAELSPGGEASVWVVLTAWLYCLGGFARLTYFTLDKTPVPGFFKGMPVPAAALLAMSPVEVAVQMSVMAPAWQGFWMTVSITVMLGTVVLMNAIPIRYLHVGRLFGRRPTLMRAAVLFWVVLVFTPWFGLVLLALMLFYAVSPSWTWHISPEQAVREDRMVREG